MLLFFGFCRKIDISPIEKARRKFVFFAWMIGTFGAMDFIPNYGYAYGINILPLGSIFMIPTYSMIGYAVVKYRLMDIRVFVTRATAFLISYPFLLCVPFIFGYRMRPILSPSLGIHWWFVPIGLMAFFATVSPLAYGQLRKKMEEVFLADQKRYQKLLLQAAAGMIRERNLNHLAKLIVYIIKRVIKIEFAAIFLNDQQNKTYSLKAIRNSNLVNLDAKFSYDDPLINYLKEHQEPVLYEELPFKIRASLKLPLTIDVIIPSIIETNLLGFVVLGEKLNHQPYSEDDINVFRTLSRQAALAISYCSFLEVFKNAQEKIFTADKLATVGGMAEGVAHQIKNRLNEFSMAAGEIDVNINDIIDKYPELMQTHPDLKKILEDSLGAIKSIFANVIHTDGIIRGILSYGNLSQDEKAKLIGEFPLKPVIDNVVELVETKHEVTNFPLILDLGPDDTIYGVKIQIHECILNILDNAYEACDERRKFRLSEQEKQNYKPFINLKLTQNEEYTFITVSDNGAGIKEQDKPKIFSPFFTTKSSYISGTGIGMYIVKRLVEENHNGKISFESEYMKGTTFYIKLPRKVKQ
jgi:signal transduction histidine kinase